MRTFPRAARRRHLAAASAAALALGALSIPSLQAAYADPDDLEDRADRLEERIDDADSALDESSGRARRAADRLSTAESDLADARDRLAEVREQLRAARSEDERMAERLVEAREDLAVAREDLAAGSADVEEQREAVSDAVVDLYTGGDPSLTAISSLLNAEDPADLTRREEADDLMVGGETAAYDDLRAAEVLLQVDEASFTDAKEAVAERRREARDNLVLQRTLTAEQAETTASVADLVTERRQAQRAADRAVAADQETLRELEEESDRVQQMLRERAAAAGADTSGAAPPSSGGFLGYPVDGYVTSPYGMRTHPIYGYYSLHDGTDFGAPCGTPMYAGAAGTVVESYYSTSYGNRLIIDHGLAGGAGLASIFNHATSYVVSPGQQVSKGQVVGYVGSTGWSTGCHLHFTVTVNGATVDPMNWL